jgi:hypothetical protein
VVVPPIDTAKLGLFKTLSVLKVSAPLVVKAAASVIVLPVPPLLASVSVLARANHALPEHFVNVTAPIAVGCVAESRPIDSIFPIGKSILKSVILTASVEIAHVDVVLPPIVNICDVLPVIFNVVPVIVTDVAPPPNVKDNGDSIVNSFANTALVEIKVPPTEIFICVNVAVLELQKFNVVDALDCVNV